MAIEDVLFAHNVKNGGEVRSVNGRQGHVTITAAELGAAPAVHKHEIKEVNGLQSALELLDTTQEYVTDMNRKSVVLSEGTHIVTSETSALADVEIEGRTLTSLANSNLEALKYYALADAKTKVIVDKKTVFGVGKFQKAHTTRAVADFAGKVAGSTILNPHFTFRTGEDWAKTTSLLEPGEYKTELTTQQYGYVNSLGNGTRISTNIVSGAMAQHLFSFNVVEQIERELGLIPRETLADKIQWVRDNLELMRINWHGFGSNAEGNKATITMWDGISSWIGSASHTLGSVSRIGATYTSASHFSRIGNDGFVHYLAYAEPSDGVTPSIINTDYVNLEIELKSTAQLNTRGKIIRVENFEGKVSGSTVENPHRAYAAHPGSSPHAAPTELRKPTEVTAEFIGTASGWRQYDSITSSDGILVKLEATNAGGIPHYIFSFNIIEAVERNIGKIPASDIAGKVSWLRDNVGNLLGRWYGFGNSSSGNKATFSAFLTNSWEWGRTHTSGSTSLIERPLPITSNRMFISDLGFVHFLAHAEPSDGITASIIHTDYIELEIELKPTANFSAPKVPLYEVTKEEYDKIGIQWDDNEVKKRFPAVEGTQHLVNPYVMAEGENLLPPFTDPAWNFHTNAKVIGPYELEMDATVAGQFSHIDIPVIPSMTYSAKSGVPDNPDRRIGYQFLRKGSSDSSYSGLLNGNVYQSSFTTTPTSDTVRIYLNNNLPGKFSFKDIMLTLGSEPKPFVPRNPSYLYVQEKLGAIGNAKDVLFKEDGKWKVRKSVEKVNLDGLLDWQYSNNYLGYKRVRIPNLTISGSSLGYSSTVSSWDGRKNQNKGATAPTEGPDYHVLYSAGLFELSLSNKDTGLPESTPSHSDIKRYFNGWKYVDGVTWTSVTGNGQTATAQQALDTKPTDYTPYKLSYVLAAPVVEEVEVEGQIKVDGVTQVGVGSGVVAREKVTPGRISTGDYSLNRSAVNSTFKKPPTKIVSIFKNGVFDNHNWTFGINSAYVNNLQVLLKGDLFDPAAEYTVTYLAEKPTFTNAPTRTKLTYANSIRASFQDVVTQVEDTSTQVSVDSKFLLDMLVQLKTLRG